MESKELHPLIQAIEKCWEVHHEGGMRLDHRWACLFNTIIVEWLEERLDQIIIFTYPTKLSIKEKEEMARRHFYLPPPEEDLKMELAQAMLDADVKEYATATKTALAFLKEKGWGPKG